MRQKEKTHLLGDYLNSEYERMVEIGFEPAKIELCIADIRRGIIEALHEARRWSAKNTKSSANALYLHLDNWTKGGK